MSKLANALRSKTDLNNFTTTEKGAITYKSTLSTVLDLFASGGALRTCPEVDVIAKFEKALHEDEQLALRCAFYLRDARGGQGERRTFKTMINHLAKANPARLRPNLKYIPLFGRWDDMFSLMDTPLETEALAIIAEQFRADLKSEQPSLLAKWMPSENASSKKTISLAKKVMEFLGMRPRAYRVALSTLRSRINVVEKLMCSKNWQEIAYGGVPSYAALRYRKAFGKHDNDRYVSYLKSVEKGEAKINSGTLYPYDLVHLAWSKGDKTIDLQWAALPDYFKGNHSNGLVIADTSGSMTSTIGNQTKVTALQACISLALYIGERNNGPFKNLFMTFSNRSTIQEIKGDTLQQKVHNLARAEWEGTTNLQAAFDNILAVAKKTNCSQDDLPDTLYIVSDMEFDHCVSGLTNFEAAKKKFEAAGYIMPNVVFWAVASRNENQPVTMHSTGTMLVSGFSPSILETILNKKVVTPYELMVEKLNSPRYAVIQ